MEGLGVCVIRALAPTLERLELEARIQAKALRATPICDLEVFRPDYRLVLPRAG